MLSQQIEARYSIKTQKDNRLSHPNGITGAKLANGGEKIQMKGELIRSEDEKGLVVVGCGDEMGD